MNNNTAVSEIVLGILYAAPALFQLLVIFGGILFAVTKVRRFPKPGFWLAFGLAIILGSRIFAWIGTIFLSRTATTESFVFFNSILSMISSLSCTGGFVLIIYAVFVSRSDDASREFPETEGVSRKNIDMSKDSNPYSTPSSG